MSGACRAGWGRKCHEGIGGNCKKYHLNRIELPEAYLAAAENGDWPDADTTQKVHEAVLLAVPKEDHLAVVGEIRKAVNGVVFGLNPFDGSIVETTVNGDTATLTVQFSMEGFGAAGAPGIPNVEIDTSGIEAGEIELAEMDLA